MDLAIVIARLKERCTGFVAIGGAADLDAAIENTPAAPAAFVMPLAEQAGRSQLMGVHAQRITQAFGVIQVVQNLRDARGAASVSELEVHRRDIRAALLGWVPDPAIGSTVSTTGGRLLLFEQGRLWWTDEFVVDDYYRSA